MTDTPLPFNVAACTAVMVWAGVFEPHAVMAAFGGFAAAFAANYRGTP